MGKLTSVEIHYSRSGGFAEVESMQVDLLEVCRVGIELSTQFGQTCLHAGQGVDTEL